MATKAGKKHKKDLMLIVPKGNLTRESTVYVEPSKSMDYPKVAYLAVSAGGSYASAFLSRAEAKKIANRLLLLLEV